MIKFTPGELKALNLIMAKDDSDSKKKKKKKKDDGDTY